MAIWRCNHPVTNRRSGATIIDLAREADVKVVEYDRFNTEGSAGGDVYVSFMLPGIIAKFARN